MSKPVILCVDDERLILDSLRTQLMHFLGEDYMIEIAQDGEEALEVLEELQSTGIEIPIIISDYIMPGMNGNELLLEVHKRCPETLTILLTGHASAEALGRALNHATLYRCLVKPWEKEDLKLTVQEALRSYSHSQQAAMKDQKLHEAVSSLEQVNQKLQESREYMFKVNQILREVGVSLDLQEIAQQFIEKAVTAIKEEGSGSIFLYNEPQNCFVSYASHGLDMEHVKNFSIEMHPEKLYAYEAVTSQKGKILDFETLKKFQDETVLKFHHGKTIFQQIVVPIVSKSWVIGLVTISNYSKTEIFTERDLLALETLTQNLASHFENSQLYAHVLKLNKVYERYVPQNFVELLNKESILEVELGDQVQKNMSILCSDIRSFTALSETLTPEENFAFINSYLRFMGPLVRQHHGFVDKYMGDSIMALFERQAEDAIDAAISMLKALVEYNETQNPYEPISVGIGVTTDSMLLGILGEQERMQGTVISDAVHLAYRLEEMTKFYGVSLLVGEETIRQVKDLTKYSYRCIDRIQAKGKQPPVNVYEFYDSDPPALFDHKESTKNHLEEGIAQYFKRNFNEAQACLEKCFSPLGEDLVTRTYWKRCNQLKALPIDENWDGVTQLT